jgi:hypothetical protein
MVARHALACIHIGVSRNLIIKLRRISTMAAWLVPPIVIPIFFAIIIFACALHVIYS